MLDLEKIKADLGHADEQESCSLSYIYANALIAEVERLREAVRRYCPTVRWNERLGRWEDYING